jgi:hypothetical protein
MHLFGGLVAGFDHGQQILDSHKVIRRQYKNTIIMALLANPTEYYAAK